jgi:GNAT superfamily N-acetyltransferase
MSHPAVREIPIDDSQQLKNFIALERQWLGSHPRYVSEVDADVLRALSGRSAFFSEMDHVLFVASAGGRDVARCAALINPRYQKAKNLNRGFIGWFAALPGHDAAVRVLFEAAEAWLRARHVGDIAAPFNGAALFGIGVRSAAFDEDPMFPFLWQPPYYAAYLESLGYQPAYPLWYYTVDFASPPYQAAKIRAAEARNVLVRPIDKNRWDPELETFLALFNECFLEEWEFQPLSIDEFHEFFDPMKPLIDPRQMLIGELHGQPVGFCLGMPDWTPLFRSFHGKVGPLQILRLLLTASRYRRAGLLGIGVLPHARGTGLAQALAVTLYRRYEQRGLKEAFYYPVNEENAPSRKFAVSLGGTGRILAHCYGKRFI